MKSGEADDGKHSSWFCLGTLLEFSNQYVGTLTISTHNVYGQNDVIYRLLLLLLTINVYYHATHFIVLSATPSKRKYERCNLKTQQSHFIYQVHSTSIN